MSEHEVVDEAGRTWKYTGVGTKKSWTTVIDGHEYWMESRPAQGGWSLARPASVNIPMNERLIAPAITAAQQYLPGYVPQDAYIPTTESVRDAFVNTHSTQGPAFDRWLKQHDDELIAAITSVLEATGP